MSTREEDEQRRQRKLEEALEVQSLRRIISAYLNYPDAAEEDVRRYERSFNKLQISHKDLLSHYPSKFQKLRRCISANAYFIYSMLQVFEPPLDMSLDGDAYGKCKGQCADNHILGESLTCSCQADLTSEMTCYRKTDESVSSNQHYAPCISQSGKLEDEEFKIQSRPGYGNGAGPCAINERQCENNNVSVVNNASIPDPSIRSSGSVKVSSSSHAWLDPTLQSNVPLVDVDKVRCIIRNVVRDWAAEGQRERDECYKPILAELDNLFPNRHKERSPACLVPGAGLGRLALEISSLGFMCQGNEFSYYMMIGSSFILNHTQMIGNWTIYPWIHSNCNSLSDRDQLRAVPIPDIHPASAGITEGFSMCGGDFVEVYSDQSQQGAWDAVVTCFFIDTAHNIIEYIEVISRILKDGGVWINLGPLLYHFADMYGQEDEMSIELSLEDVKMIASYYGFKMERESNLETTYTTNPRSMMQNRYHAAFWTMTKQRS